MSHRPTDAASFGLPPGAWTDDAVADRWEPRDAERLYLRTKLRPGFPAAPLLADLALVVVLLLAALLAGGAHVVVVP